MIYPADVPVEDNYANYNKILDIEDVRIMHTRNYSILGSTDNARFWYYTKPSFLVNS